MIDKTTHSPAFSLDLFPAEESHRSLPNIMNYCVSIYDKTKKNIQGFIFSVLLLLDSGRFPPKPSKLVLLALSNHMKQTWRICKTAVAPAR